MASLTGRKRHWTDAKRGRAALATATLVLSAAVAPAAADARPDSTIGEPVVLVSGLQGTMGSTIGPDGALYVTEAAVGRVSRIDPDSGVVTTFAEGLPLWSDGFGGAMDVAFLGGRAYVLVTAVDFAGDGSGSALNGIYRVDGPDEVTLIADLGRYSAENLPDTSYFIATGVQFALETYRGGFLVSDGHHNRILEVSRRGRIEELIAFGNIVPTGLEVDGDRVLTSTVGPVPHYADTGTVLAFRPGSPNARRIAAGVSMLIDVERGRGQALYALSQGTVGSGEEGAPAAPKTGSLVAVGSDGSLSVLVGELNQPTSLDFIGTTAYVVTLTGEVLRIDNVFRPPQRR